MNDQLQRHRALNFNQKLLDALLSTRRKYAAFFNWHNKQTEERGVVVALLRSPEYSGDKELTDIRSNTIDPPDVVANETFGGTVAFEVTELVDEEAIRLTIRGEDIYRDWADEQLIGKIESILSEKDQKVFRGGPYSRVVLVIHTDEPLLLARLDHYKHVISAHRFPKPKQIHDVYLLFSHDPRVGRCPVARLEFN